MADMPEKKPFDRALPNLTAYEIALAAASIYRILINFLIKVGVDRDEIEEAFRDKAQELIVEQSEDNAANLLRMITGVSRPRQPDA